MIYSISFLFIFNIDLFLGDDHPILAKDVRIPDIFKDFFVGMNKSPKIESMGDL